MKKERKELQALVDFQPTGGFCWGKHKYRQVPAQTWDHKRLQRFKCERCGKRMKKYRGILGLGS